MTRRFYLVSFRSIKPEREESEKQKTNKDVK